MEILAVALGAVLFYLLQNRIYSKFWDWNLDLDIEFSDNKAFEGEKLFLTETLKNAKVLPLPYITVKFHISRNLEFPDAANAKVTDNYYRNDLFGVLMNQKITRKIEFICKKRGYYRIKSADVISGNLFSTASYVKKNSYGAYLAVYPSIMDLPEMDLPLLRLNGEALSNLYLNPDPLQFKGIRGYLPGDSMKSVNYKASARAGELMVNLYENTFSRKTFIFLSVEKESGWANYDMVEKAISAAASIAYRSIKEGAAVALISNGRDVLTGEEVITQAAQGDGCLFSIWESLARVDLEKPPVPLSSMIDEYNGEYGSGTICILVSAYEGEDLQESFQNLSRVSPSHWIIPMYKNAPYSNRQAQGDHITRIEYE